jgi:hypothetical protein
MPRSIYSTQEIKEVCILHGCRMLLLFDVSSFHLVVPEEKKEGAQAGHQSLYPEVRSIVPALEHKKRLSLHVYGPVFAAKIHPGSVNDTLWRKLTGDEHLLQHFFIALLNKLLRALLPLLGPVKQQIGAVQRDF